MYNHLMDLPYLNREGVFGKTVFLRLDLDVPLSQDGEIRDTSRLKAGLSTLDYLLKNKAKVIIGGHLGRPKKDDTTLSLISVAKWFAANTRLPFFSLKSEDIENFKGWRINNQLFLLENLRFYEGEEKNDPEFAKKLSLLAQIYVNDAFAVCHRNNASISMLPEYLPHFAGLRLQKEIKELSGILNNPKRPLVVIIGGAKIETKLPLVEKMHGFADYVLVGGEIAQQTRILLKLQHEKIKGRKSVLLVADSNINGTDITLESMENFLQIVDLGKTIIWNGPMGKIEEKDSQKGTLELAGGIVKSKAFSIVGGGETVEFLDQINFLSKFSFVSTGGGAMLSFLSGEKLPGIEALLK